MSWSTLTCLVIAIVPAILFPFTLYLLLPRNNSIQSMLKLFFMGAVVSIPVFICYSLVDKFRFDLMIDKYSAIIILINIIIEESWKLIGALVVVYKFKLYFKTWIEAILIGFTIGAGFGFVENSFFIMNYYESDSFIDLIITRKYMIGLPHSLWSAFAVLALFFTYKYRLFSACLFFLCSILLHFFYNMNILYANIPASAIYIAMYIGIVVLFAYEKFKPVVVEAPQSH